MSPFILTPLIFPRHPNLLRPHILALHQCNPALTSLRQCAPDLASPHTPAVLRLHTALCQCTPDLAIQVSLDPRRNGCRRIFHIKLPVLKLLADPALELILEVGRL